MEGRLGSYGGRLAALPFLAVVLFAQATPELVVSVGHAGAPSHVAFAGGYLATASASNVALIDLSTGLTIGHLPQAGLVMSMEASPEGDVLAVGACGHAIHLWSVKSRTELRRIALKQECAESVSFSPDGALLATGSYGCCIGGGLQVWDVRTGALTRELAQSAGIRAVVFSRDGRWLVGIDDKATARVFEWPSGRLLRTLDGFEGAGTSEAAALASPDGKYLAWLGHYTLQLWDISTGAQVPLPERMMVAAAEFLNDGQLAYVDDDRLRIFTLPNGPMRELTLERPKTEWLGDVGITMSPSWLRIRRDGAMLAGTDHTRTILWDVAAAKLRRLGAPALTDATSLQWHRSGLIAWADLQSGIRAWNDRTGDPVDFAKAVASATELVFDPDGRRLAVSTSSSLDVVDLQRRRSVSSLEVPPAMRTGVAFSPDGTRLAFASSNGLATFDGSLRQQTRLAALEKYTSAEYVAWSPDGRWIAAGLTGPQPVVRVWPSTQPENAVTLAQSRLSYGPQPPAFSTDSRWLASFMEGESLALWSTGSWKLERTWKLTATGRALAFAPQGSRLAIATDEGAAVWDASSGGVVVRLVSPGSSKATQIAWSPDGNRIVTCADDGVLRFWHAADGRLIASLYTLAASRDWLLVAADGRLDGSERALATLVAWRTEDRVSMNSSLTRGRRVGGLWRLLSSAGITR